MIIDKIDPKSSASLNAVGGFITGHIVTVIGIALNVYYAWTQMDTEASFLSVLPQLALMGFTLYVVEIVTTTLCGWLTGWVKAFLYNRFTWLPRLKTLEDETSN